MLINSNTDFIKKLYKNDFEIIEITTKKNNKPKSHKTLNRIINQKL